jgi:hypothetical protein
MGKFLVAALRSLNDCATNDLARLGPPNSRDGKPDLAAGDPEARKVIDRLAPEAVHVWAHFRRDRRPSSKAYGPFIKFVETLQRIATGKSAYMGRSAQAAIAANAVLLADRYPSRA